MPDIAEIARRSHETGFEQGSIVAANAILSYLEKFGPHTAAMLKAAWEAGRIAEASGLSLASDATTQSLPAVEFDPGPRKMTREEARGKGFTGNTCSHCGSSEMQVAGHCEVCASCGTTTGCS
jgi:hypothetical protein